MSESQDSMFSDDERKRMQKFAEHLQENGTPNAYLLERPTIDEIETDPRAEWKGRFRVSEKMCQRMRHRASVGCNYSEVAEEFDVSERVARYHVNDDCKHEHEAVIDPERCAVIREMARDGMTYPAINQWAGAGSPSTVRQHAVGDCTCDRYHDVPPYTERRVEGRADEATDEQCTRWRQRVRDGESPNDISNDPDVEHSAGRIRQHVYGRCECDADEPELPAPEASMKSDREQCAEWRRRARREQITPNGIASDPAVGFSHKSVSYHVYGRCTCTNDVEPLERGEIDPGTVTEPECSEWRARVMQGGESAASIAKDPDVDWSSGTVQKHVYGRCSCDHDTPAADPNRDY